MSVIASTPFPSRSPTRHDRPEGGGMRETGGGLGGGAGMGGSVLLPASVPADPPSLGLKRRATRSCGTCNACCIAPSIPELDKPLDTPCPHLKQGPKGCCSVYADRPQVCRTFLCGWRLGFGGQFDRPDLLGVMMQPTQKSNGQTLLAFVEVRPKALDSRRARELMVHWAAATGEAVTTRRAQSRHFVSIPVTIERREVAGAAHASGLPRAAAGADDR